MHLKMPSAKSVAILSGGDELKMRQVQYLMMRAPTNEKLGSFFISN